MKRFLIILLNIIWLTSALACSDDKLITTKTPVIFDTDLGNDVDDILALQMLLNYHKAGEINLIGITVSKSNPYSFLYIDAYNRFNKINNIPLGYVYEGPNKDNGNYLHQTLDTVIDQKHILSSTLSVSSQIPKAFLLQRKLLAKQPDKSVVFVVVGPQTNMQRLLESGPDKYSGLNGLELVRRKVKMLVVMGGNFDVQERNFPEWNIVQDIQAAQAVFHKWPTTLVASGYEVGQKLLYPHQSILNDFNEGYKHPLVVSYKLFEKMPYDRETWDLTAVLHAIEPDAGWFDVSGAGNINIDDNGKTVFTPSANGNRYYLKNNPGRIPATLRALVHAVTGR